ncbi:hypothetical protein A5821_002683 [Enterococcus sp. 7F3_DIV0205]|uniref:Gram-positive cocci surface proteins LPxTG domain-containing protein n=1 Tax=Candidatus Enterococcus palustris TaxID=1834189 RepID=A0AAQ3WCQ6_9ENTE|nr:LPXTG cell wall anchor domain-containing protein [Enterococcus sp. 7F3_DIV0205]OTN83116.1 hypothetical protein A5821_003039 [Enterococcus sp. 7F3_DIV0205]
MKNLKYYVLTSIVLVSFFAITPLSAKAEGGGNGGAVQTTGGVGFYEDETTPTTTPSTTEEPKEKPSPKPKGRYPSTGELVARSLSISGVAVVVIVVIYFIWKRKKENAEKGKER